MANDLKITARIEDAGLREGLQQIADEIRRVGEASKEGFDQTREAAESGMRAMQETVAHGIEGVRSQFESIKRIAEGVFAVLATGGAFREVIDQTQEWAFEVEHLARALGTTTSSAAGWALAANEAGVNVNTVDRAMRGLGMTLRTNAEAFDKLKISVREGGAAATDTGHALLPLEQIIKNVVARVEEYKAGADRLTVTQAVFRRAQPGLIEDMARLAEHLEGAKERAEAFGISIGTDGVERARQYEAVVADMKAGLLGFEEVIATAVLPELESLDRKVIDLAKSGQLREWAYDAVAGMKLLLETGRGVEQFLVEHAQLVRFAAEAWLFYRGALLGVAAAGSIVGVIKTITTAVTEANLVVFAAGQFFTGAASAAEAYAFAAEAVGVSTSLLTGGLSIVFGLLAAGVGYWAMNKLGADQFRASLDNLRDHGAEAVDTLKLKYSQAREEYEQTVRSHKEGSKEEVDAYNKVVDALNKLEPAIKANVAAKKAAYQADVTAMQAAEAKKEETEAKITQARIDHNTRAVNALKLQYDQDELNFEASRKKMTASQQAFMDALQQGHDAKHPFTFDSGSLNAPDLKTGGGDKDQKAYEALMHAKELELAMVKGNADRELEIENEYYDKIKALAFKNTDFLVQQRAKVVEATRKAVEDDAKIEAIGIESADKIEKIKYDEKKRIIDDERQLGIISNEDATQQLQQALDQRYQKEVDALKQKQALYADDRVKYAEYQAQLDVLAEQHTADRLQIEAKEFKEFANQIKGVIDTIGGDFEQVLTGMLQGTQTWQQAVSHLWQNLATSAAHVVEQMVAKWAAGELAKVIATRTGNAAMLASDNTTFAQRLIKYLADFAHFQTTEVKKTTTKKTQDTAQLTSQEVTDQMSVASTELSNEEKKVSDAEAADKSLLASAASAAGKAYDAYADIPYVGPIIGAAAAAATFAAVMAFGGYISAAGGADIGQESPIAQLHPKEMVLPQSIADHIRQAIKNPESAKGLLHAAQGRGLDNTKGGAIELLMRGDMVLPKEIASAVRDMASGASGGASRAADGVPSEQPKFQAAKGGVSEGGKTKLHPGEMVVPGGGGGDHSAPGGVGHASDTNAMEKEKGVGGKATGGAPAGSALAGGKSGGGGDHVQKVHVVASSTDVKVQGHVTTTIKDSKQPLGVTYDNGGGDFGTVDNTKGPKQVTVTNVPLKTSFTAILLSVSLGELNFLTVGTLLAFARGGDVPEDTMAQLHRKEMVLPANIADPLRDAISGKGAENFAANFNAVLGVKNVQFAPQLDRPEAVTPAQQQSIRNWLDGDHERGGDTHVHITYQALDVPTGDEVLARHSRTLGKLVSRELRLSQRHGPRPR